MRQIIDGMVYDTESAQRVGENLFMKDTGEYFRLKEDSLELVMYTEAKKELDALEMEAKDKLRKERQIEKARKAEEAKRAEEMKEQEKVYTLNFPATPEDIKQFIMPQLKKRKLNQRKLAKLFDITEQALSVKFKEGSFTLKQFEELAKIFNKKMKITFE